VLNVSCSFTYGAAATINYAYLGGPGAARQFYQPFQYSGTSQSYQFSGSTYLFFTPGSQPRICQPSEPGHVVHDRRLRAVTPNTFIFFSKKAMLSFDNVDFQSVSRGGHQLI
jgi:hypothetical protein